MTFDTKVAFAPVMALPDSSSTLALMATYTVCTELKSLTGSIVMIVLAALIVASKAISLPLASVSFSVINASTF